MKTQLTYSMMMAMLFLVISSAQTFAQGALDNRDEDHPNFSWIDDFEEDVASWWNPEGSGQTTGIILEDDEGNLITYREHETDIVNPATGSTGSMKLAVVWDTDVEWVEPTDAGSASHYIREYMPAGNANVEGKRFLPGQALEIFVYGDGSNNRFKLMVRDGAAQLEGSQWFDIDWTGWKRLTWDYNDAANVFGWVTGDGEMTEGNPFYFDSIHITRDEAGTTTEGMFYFDDLRIVDPFNVDFNIADADGTEVIAINNETYDAGQTEFELFPGEHEYFVHKDGYETHYGTFEIDDEDITVDVTLTEGNDPEYIVDFTVMDEEGDLIDNAEITINDIEYDAGVYDFELTPGFYDYEVSTNIHFDAVGNFAIIDDELFLNVVLEEIPDLYDKAFLSWDVASTASTPEFREEYYSVWMGNAGDDPEDFWMIFDETLDADEPNWEYQHRRIEVSEYSEENIQIAFRHHNITDNDRVVIDNVALEGINVNDEDEYVFHETFEGGIPDDFDPEDPEYDEGWLPEEWEAVDADGDDFNWYFAIHVEQDLSYKAHMRSQSWDPTEGPLTPDNWLFSPAIQMPLVNFYNVSFNIVDDEDNPVDNAVITLDDVTYDPGQYEFSLTNGEYDYSISKEGHETVDGSFVIDSEDVEVDVVLPLIPMYEVTFNVDMTYAEDFEPGETNVYMTGSFPAWDWDVPGTHEAQQLDPTDNVFIFTRTLELPAGTYQYKYFDGPSFDDGEWPGDPNREVEVEGEMVVEDFFGSMDDPTFVNDTEAETIHIFPNPARDIVNINSGTNIREISVYSMNGQLVYETSVDASTFNINLNNLNPGMYLIRITSEESHSIHKLQITK